MGWAHDEQRVMPASLLVRPGDGSFIKRLKECALDLIAKRDEEIAELRSALQEVYDVWDRGSTPEQDYEYIAKHDASPAPIDIVAEIASRALRKDQ